MSWTTYTGLSGLTLNSNLQISLSKPPLTLVTNTQSQRKRKQTRNVCHSANRVYKSSSGSLSLPTPNGPGSGFLVNRHDGQGKLNGLPLPQNKILAATYDDGEFSYTTRLLFIPVIDQPLFANRYYVIASDGDYQGLAYEASTEEDTATSCCRTYIKGRKPRPLNPLDPYQQFKVTLTGSRKYAFTAKPVAPDGVVTGFLGQGWDLHTPSLKHQIPQLPEACGLISIHRDRLPNFESPSRPETVGKWACPYMFIRDGKAKEQVKKSAFYEMTLERRWERILACENVDEVSSVVVNVVVDTQVWKVDGRDVVAEKDEGSGVVWLWSVDDEMKKMKVGVGFVVVERMMWEEERVGWVEGSEKKGSVSKVEVFKEGGEECCSWRRYGCYVLVERFVLRRMDGSLVLTCDFKHTRQMRSIWE